jgi:hypothetical protein
MTKRARAREAAKTRAEVERQFAKLEAVAASSPGLETLLSAYGYYETAMRQMDSYLAMINPAPKFTVSTTSG